MIKEQVGRHKAFAQSPQQRACVQTGSKPVHFLILNPLFVPEEDAGHGREQFTRRGMLALESAPYAAHQGPSGPLRVQVRVKFADLTRTPEPLSGYEAAVVREYGEQALPLRAGASSLGGVGTCSVKPDREQAHCPAQPRDLL